MKLNFNFKFLYFPVDFMTSERTFHRKRCGLKILLEKISCEPVDSSCEKLPLKISGHFPALPISMVVLHINRHSERGSGGWVTQPWQFQHDVIIEQLFKIQLLFPKRNFVSMKHSVPSGQRTTFLDIPSYSKFRLHLIFTFKWFRVQ